MLAGGRSEMHYTKNLNYTLREQGFRASIGKSRTLKNKKNFCLNLIFKMFDKPEYLAKLDAQNVKLYWITLNLSMQKSYIYLTSLKT